MSRRAPEFLAAKRPPALPCARSCLVEHGARLNRGKAYAGEVEVEHGGEGAIVEHAQEARDKCRDAVV